jgi:hypothetical protein
MTRQHRSRALQTALLLCCFAWLDHAHAQSSSGDVVYHLHGSVVDGTTGKPLARALVQSSDRRIAVMTDSEGNFAVDLSVPPRVAGASTAAGPRLLNLGGNQFVLTAQKPGYMPAQQLSLLPLDDTLSSTDVKLKLMPMATITGRVSASGTDDPFNVRVTLLLHQGDGEGRRIWMQMNSQNTNSRGEFRFTNLRPGEYTLMTGEWRGDGPLPPRPNTITQQYPPVFYGDAQSLAGAVKLHLHYGDTAQAELHLHLATYYPVTVPIANRQQNSSVNVRLVDTESFGGFGLGYNFRDGVVEGSLPNGHYNLLLNSFGQQQASALVSINVDGAPVRTAAITLVPAGTIPVRIHTQFSRQQTEQPNQAYDGPLERLNGSRTGQAPPLVQLLLQSEDGIGYATTPVRHGSSDDLVLQNVTPGTYFVRAQVFRGYAASVTSGGVDLLQQPLIVSAAGTAEPIDVTLRDDSARLTGSVTSGSNSPLQPTFILLLPTDTTAQYVQGFAGPDGKFTIPSLVPGNYRVFAIRNMREQIPYRDPESMREYDGKGSTFTAAPGQQIQMDVPLLDAADVEDE